MMKKKKQFSKITKKYLQQKTIYLLTIIISHIGHGQQNVYDCS